MSPKAFTKLFKSILQSTLWVQQPHHVRVVWITMLAMADSDGMVASSVPGLAAASRVTLEECEEALAVFLAPDKYSRTPDHDGRRIEAVMGGWVLLNYETYRRSIDADSERERKRIYMRARREEERTRSSPQSATVAIDGDVASSSSSLSPSESGSDPENRKSSRSRGMVYLATYAGADSFKVGFTRNDPYSRAKELATGCPGPLQIIEAIPGTQALEREIHGVLASHRTNGEWFSLTPESRGLLRRWFTRDPSGDPRLTAKRPGAVFAPDDLGMNPAQLVRCQELHLDSGELLSAFKNHEFNRSYTDWPRRLSKWIEDERLKRETERAVTRRRNPDPDDRLRRQADRIRMLEEQERQAQ